ncbi:PKD domain-containing protein [Candidatus Bipolaricaulota bacterium]|nr:PKD domain-containing protein [Candidatus Bipolaricaulota bacterium]
MKKLLAAAMLGALAALVGCTPQVGPATKILAVITAAPTQGQAPLQVHFDATRSTDPEGALTDFLWDFGDGSPVASGREVDHTFDRAGEYMVTLVVVGPSGTGRATTVVRALNNPPTAAFTFYPQDPFEDEEVTFDGSGSSDPDGDIVRWTWDFGDGATGDGEIVRHTFANPGQYLVVLTVTDSAGAEGRTSKLVTVDDCSSGHCGRR